MSQVNDVHKEPAYWGKPLSELVDLELIQAHAYCKLAEERREKAKDHPKFTTDREINGVKVKKLVLPPINPNFKSLKDAIETELQKRNIQL